MYTRLDAGMSGTILSFNVEDSAAIIMLQKSKQVEWILRDQRTKKQRTRDKGGPQYLQIN